MKQLTLLLAFGVALLGQGSSIPTQAKDISTPLAPPSGYTKVYTKGGKICSENSSAAENCTGSPGASPAGSAITDAQCWASASTFGVCANITISGSMTGSVIGHSSLDLAVSTLAALSTGVLKVTTGTGALSIAASGDLPGGPYLPLTGGTLSGTLTGTSISLSGSISTGSSGAAAGYLQMGQGTAPSNGTTSIQIAAPSSVTSYQVILPGAAATGFPFWTNAANTITQTTIGTTGTGNVVLATSPTFVTGLSSPAITDSGLTSGRIPYSTTGGLLTDNAAMLLATLPGSGIQLRLVDGAGNGPALNLSIGGQNVSFAIQNAANNYFFGGTGGDYGFVGGGGNFFITRNGRSIAKFGTKTSTPPASFVLYDETPSSGVTDGQYIEGAGQSTSEVFGIYANNGTTKRIDVTNNIFTVTSGATFLSSAVIMSGLGAASGTPSSICQNGTTITVNAALTCTVSSAIFKTKISHLNIDALALLARVTPAQFAYRDAPNRLRWGFIAEEVSDVDQKLADAFTSDGPRSIDQNAILALTVKAVQELTKKVEELKK